MANQRDGDPMTPNARAALAEMLYQATLQAILDAIVANVESKPLVVEALARVLAQEEPPPPPEDYQRFLNCLDALTAIDEALGTQDNDDPASSLRAIAELKARADAADARLRECEQERDELRAEVAGQLSEHFRAVQTCYDTPLDHYREMARRLAESRDELKHANRKLEAIRGRLRTALERVTADMDLAGGDNHGMPECPWCHTKNKDEHAADCELLAARAALIPSPEEPMP